MADQSAIDQLATATQTVSSQTRRAADEARMAEIRKLQGEMREAMESRDKQKLNLINQRLQSLIEAEGEEKKALVDTLKGLRDAGKALGVEITVAEEATPAEKASLAAAKTAVGVAKGEYEKILNDPPFFFRESRTNAAKRAVEDAETTLERVEISNARAAARRLDEIDIEQASQRLIAVSQNAQDAIEHRRTVIQTEVENAQGEIDRVQKLDQELATRLDELKLQVAKADQRRSDAKVDLDRMQGQSGSEAFSIAQQELQAAEDAYKEATNERDAAMEVRNQVQLNLEYTKTHLVGQRDIQTALMVFQKTMEEQLNGLVVQYKSRVEAARALADLKFGSDVHETSNKVMSDMANYMAKAGAAANEEVAAMAEAQPEAIRAARATVEEQREASAVTQARIDAVFADMERNYQQKEHAA